MRSPAPRTGGLQAGEGEELAGPLHAAPSFADALGGRPPPARERVEGGVAPPAAPASSKAGMPRREREQRRGGAPLRLAGGR